MIVQERNLPLLSPRGRKIDTQMFSKFKCKFSSIFPSLPVERRLVPSDGLDDIAVDTADSPPPQPLRNTFFFLVRFQSGAKIYGSTGPAGLPQTFSSPHNQLISPSRNSSLMDCLRDLQSGRSKPKSAHSSDPLRFGMVMVWRTRKCTASMTRCRCSSPEVPMEMVAALLLERRSCCPP